MKVKEKQRLQRELGVTKQTKTNPNSSEDEDSDVEKNFALLTDRRGEMMEGHSYQRGEEEVEFSKEEEEEKEGSDSGEKEEVDEDNPEDSKGKEGAEGDAEEDGDSEASEDEDDDPEAVGGSTKIQTREDIKKELSHMSFEDVIKLQNKVGTKVYNSVAYGNKKSQKTNVKKRLNKNRPTEIMAKTPVPFLRQVVPVRKPTLRDPRFDDLSGEYKPEIFEKTYKFISDIRKREKEVVQRQLKRTSNKRKEKLQFLLKRMENQERAMRSQEQQRERELHFKRQQRERANQGAQPFFFKKSEKKKLQLAEKYQELKKSGKLENFLSKKRKRNAVKDRRKLPQLPQKKAS